MARPLRISFPGAIFHIVSRGNANEEIFRDAADRRFYLSLLDKYQQSLKFSLFAYTLMDNHIHLLLQINDHPLPKVMHLINTAYTVYFNLKWERKGHLMQGRYYSALVQKESYLLAVSRYIHLNPVRANLVKYPEQWPWSSCRAYLGLEKINYVCVEEALALLNDTYSSYKAFLYEDLNAKLPIRYKKGVCFIASDKYIAKIVKRELTKSTSLPKQ